MTASKSMVWTRIAVALGAIALTAPLLWTKLDPDFDTGLVKLKFMPSNAMQFLSVVVPAALVGMAIAGLGAAWGKYGPSKPVIATGAHKLFESPKALAITAAILSAFAFAMGGKALSVGTFVCLHIMLAIGLNVTIGFTGLLVLGYAAFYATGAYVFALLGQAIPGFPTWLALPVGFLIAATAGFLVGLPCLRLRGDYLAIVTLGFAEAFREIIRNLSITGGDMGLVVPMASRIKSVGPLSQAQASWIAAVVVTLLVALFVHRLYHSRIGRAWIAIREDETAAAMMGIPVVRLKLLAFSVSAGIAGFAGAFFAGFTGFVDPSTATFEQSVLILAMVILGGIGSLPGSILGACVLYLVPSLLRDWFPAISDYRLFFFGTILVAMMLFRPQGLCGSPRHKLELEGQG
jgi:branched-chain amino acid transport system permease protein